MKFGKEFSKEDRELFESAQKTSRAGDFQTAIEQFKALIIKYPKIGLLHAVLANNYWDLGDLDIAESEFRIAVELYPKNEHCSLPLFHLLWERGKETEGFNEIRRFLSIAKSAEYEQLLNEMDAEYDELLKEMDANP
jgi:tetratricopeptide (TPR) repeat protein